MPPSPTRIFHSAPPFPPTGRLAKCEEILGHNATALLDQTRIGLTNQIKDVTQQQIDFINNRKRSTSPTQEEQPGGDFKRFDKA